MNAPEPGLPDSVVTAITHAGRALDVGEIRAALGIDSESLTTAVLLEACDALVDAGVLERLAVAGQRAKYQLTGTGNIAAAARALATRRNRNATGEQVAVVGKMAQRRLAIQAMLDRADYTVGQLVEMSGEPYQSVINALVDLRNRGTATAPPRGAKGQAWSTPARSAARETAGIDRNPEKVVSDQPPVGGAENASIADEKPEVAAAPASQAATPNHVAEGVRMLAEACHEMGIRLDQAAKILSGAGVPRGTKS